MDLRNYLFLSGRLPGMLPMPMNAPPGPSMGPQPVMGGNARNPALGAIPFPGQDWKQAGPLTPPAPLPPPKGRGFLGSIDDVFGGPDMKNLTPEQQKAARRRGLLAFGAQMLTATDPRGNRAQGLSALGQGVMAAQAGYGQGIEQGMMQNMERQRAAMYAALAPLPGENTEQRYARYLKMLDTAVLQQDKNAMTAISQALNTMPKPGEGTADVSWQNITDAQGNIVQLNPKTGTTRPVLGSDGKPLKAYRASSDGAPINWQTTQAADGSLLQVNPRTGATRPVVDAQGKPVMGRQRPLTGAEAKSAGFHAQALAASQGLDDPVFSEPQSPGSVALGALPIIGNAFRSSSDQQRRQLAQQFINAVLRNDSGAAVPDSEYPKYEAVYIPVYGDSPETLARKKMAREIMIATLETSAGRALSPTSPDGLDEFGSMDADASGR